MFAVVGTHQSEGHRHISDRVGRQKQRVMAQVEFIHTKCARELPKHTLAVLGHVQLSNGVGQAVVDETCGEIEEEIPLETTERGLDVHAVVDDAVENSLPDFVVVLGSWQDAFG